MRHSRGLGLLMLVALIALLTACDESSPTAASTPTSLPATVAPKDVQATATIGMNITAFTGAYGKPTKSDVTAGSYSYTTADKTTLDVTVRTKAPGHNLVLAVLLTPAQDWTPEEATAHCLALAPKDAKPGKRTTFSGGVQDRYISATLAQAVPKDEFVDAQLNPTAPGTFAVVLTDDTSATLISSCSVQIGLQVQ